MAAKMTVAQVMHLKNCTDQIIAFDNKIDKMMSQMRDANEITEDRWEKYREERYEFIGAINSIVLHVYMLTGAEFSIKG